MPDFDYDFSVFIGRFQPFHLGHHYVVSKALEATEHVIVLIGSAHQPRSLRNPFSFREREQQLRTCFSFEQNQRIFVAPLMDVLYNEELWIKNVQETIYGFVRAHHKHIQRTPSIALIGHRKDHSSYYLNLFPQWDSIQVEHYAQIDASALRAALFEKQVLESIQSKIHANTFMQLESFLGTEAFSTLCEEHSFLEKYRSAWAKAPYPPTFVTVDAIVIQSGHVLLVQRKAKPGKGLLALPGGFIQAHERLQAAMLRELREETKIKVPEPVLRGSITKRNVFDYPYRSLRGRTIMHAYLIELKPEHKLPKVKGGDDAQKALWKPLAEVDPTQMFEDHYFILQSMLGVL